jgi:polar amino acid transport system substrate-binding protein
LRILAPLFATLLALTPLAAHAAEAPARESAYDRVMRTGTLRCGYIVIPPHVIKDPNTGAMSGVIVDMMNEAAKLLEIKVEWAEEVGWGNTVEALKGGRVDAICVNYWMNPVEGRFVGFSMPFYYSTVGAYVRADDHRFDAGLAPLNDPTMKVATVEGSISGVIARQDYPRATVSTLPNLTDTSQVLLEVSTGKADLTFADNFMGQQFMAANPSKLRNVTVDHPVRAFPSTIALPSGEVQLKTMIDSAFVQLLYSGFVDRTLTRYNVPASAIYRVARPYEIPAQ